MKVSDEEKVRQRALELERLKQSLFDSNKSTDPRLVTAAVQPSVSLMAPVPPRAERPEVSEGGEKYTDESIEQGERVSVQTAVELPVQPIKTSLAEAIRKFRVPVLEVDDHIRSHRQDYGEGDGVQHIQMTSYRHVVAREQRACESQRAEHREDDHWRIKSSGLCSCRGDVEHRVECGQKQHRRLSRSSFP